MRTQLEQGQDIGRDIVVLTDWMAALWIQNGFVQKLNKDLIPNWTNLLPKFYYAAVRPGPPVLAAVAVRASARSAGTRPSSRRRPAPTR